MSIRTMCRILLPVFVFMFLMPLSAQAAVLYFYPQEVTLNVGEQAFFDVRIDTEGQQINAVELEGYLSGVAATVAGIDEGGSALDIFVERPSIKGKSFFQLAGGTPGEIIGEHLLARIAVRAELAGASSLSFDSDKTRILLADGAGTIAAERFLSATIRVLPRAPGSIVVTSVSHPDENQWYATDVAQIQFTFVPGSEYSYLVTRDPLAEPDEIADRPEGTATWSGETKIEGLPDGVSYFAVKKIGSTLISRYRLMNDLSKPEWVEVNKSNGTPETEERPFLAFLAKDSISGVEYYEMKIDEGESFIVTSPQPLPDEYSMLSIRAYDRAGNYIEEFVPGPIKDYTLLAWTIVLIVLLIWTSGILNRRKRDR